MYLVLCFLVCKLIVYYHAADLYLELGTTATLNSYFLQCQQANCV